MNKFRIQRYATTVTIPVNNDTEDAPALSGNNAQLNGVLRGITIDAPALTGTAFTLWILGQRGELLFTKASLVESAKNYIGVDANNHPLRIPLALNGVSPVRIKATGTPDATGVLTFQNDGPITDGKLVTIGDQVYRAKTALAAANDFLIEPDVKATGLMDCGATGAIALDSFVLGATPYTIVAALSVGPTVPNEILLEADVDDTLANIKAAINGGAGIGVKYSTGTVANASAEATTLDDTAHTLLIQALVAGPAGNSIVFTESMADTTFNGSGVLGGSTPGSWSGDNTLQNLSDAIELEDGGGQSGVKYHASTPANAYVTAGDVASHAITVTAVDGVDDPADVDTTTDEPNFTWGAATLVGGGEATAKVFNVDLLIDRG